MMFVFRGSLSNLPPVKGKCVFLWTQKHANVLTNTSDQTSNIAALPQENSQVCPTMLKNKQSHVLKHKTKARGNSAEVQDAMTIEDKSCIVSELVVACAVSRDLHLTHRGSCHIRGPCQIGTSSNVSSQMQMFVYSVVSSSCLCRCTFTTNGV